MSRPTADDHSMNMALSPELARPRRTTEVKHAELSRVLGELDRLCTTLGPGGQLPRHTELMRNFGATERAVLRSIEELKRRGRVIRRHGSGTFVANPISSSMIAPSSVSARTITAIARPDRAVFDLCLELLYDAAQRSDLRLSCHILGPTELDTIDVAHLGHPLGFVVFSRLLAPIARQLHQAGQRVVIVGAPHVGETFDVPSVYGNHEHGGHLVLSHIAELGHRRIALIDLSGKLRNTTRWQGYQRAVADARRAGIDLDLQVVDAATVSSWMETPEIATRFFKGNDAPTAAVAWNDNDALQLLATLARAQISVPGIVSVTGYDNMATSQRCAPPLTTVETQLSQQILTATDMLTRPIQPPANQALIFSPSLVVRSSTAPPPPR